MPVKYRVGLVGCGRMGATIDDEVKDRPNAHIFLPYSHAAAIVASERTELVAVSDPVAEKAEAIRARYGAGAAYADHEAMIDAEALDIIAVATRPGPHADIVCYAAEKGVPGVYCEKPLCNAVHEMDAMLSACTKNNVKFNYGTQRRYMPVYARVREMIGEGAIGDLQAIVAHCGASAAQWGLTHAADMLLFLAGDGEIDFVQGTMVTQEEDWQGSTLKRDAAICSAYVRFKNGVHGYLTASGGWEFEASGSKGKLRTLSNSMDYQLRQADEYGELKQVPVPEVEIGSGTQRGIEDLARALDDGGDTLGNLEIACRSQEMVFAVAESHRRGGVRVEVPLVDRELAIAPENY
jgi:predicted dehydrogenase